MDSMIVKSCSSVTPSEARNMKLMNSGEDLSSNLMTKMGNSLEN